MSLNIISNLHCYPEKIVIVARGDVANNFKNLETATDTASNDRVD